MTSTTLSDPIPQESGTDSSQVNEQILDGVYDVKTQAEFDIRQKRNKGRFKRSLKRLGEGSIKKDVQQYSSKLWEDFATKQDIRVHLYAERIRRHQLSLNAIVHKHGGKIYKAWRHKSRTQRIDLLKKANKNIPAQHGPDIEIHRSISASATPNNQNREALMMPYVNSDDLSQGSILPLFMRTRAFTEPYKFAIPDSYHFTWGIGKMIAGPPPIPGYGIWLAEPSDNREYGKMASLEERSDAEEWAKPGKALNCRAGFLALDAQQRTYTFLKKCCQLVLPDVDLGGCEDNTITHPNNFELPADAHDDIPDSMRSHLEGPYLPPTLPSLARFYEIVSAEALAAESHLERLRGSPASFRRTVHDYLVGWNRHSSISSGTEPNSSEDFAAAFKGVLCTAYRSLHVWRKLEGVAEIFRNVDTEGDLWAKRYTLAKLDTYCVQLAYEFMRNLVSFVEDEEKLERSILHASEDHVQLFRWLLDQLKRSVQNSQAKPDIPQYRICQELHRLVSAAQLEQHLPVSFAVSLENLSILSECMHELHRSEDYQSQEVKEDDLQAAETDYKQWDQGWTTFRATFDRWNIDALVGFALPLESALEYPEDEFRSRETVEQMISAETCLGGLRQLFDNFAYLDDFFVTNFQQVQADFTIKHTTKWVEPDPLQDTLTEDGQTTEQDQKGEAETEREAIAEQEEVIARVVDTAVAKTANGTLRRSTRRSNVDRDTAYTGSKFIAPEPRIKVKTRGVPAPSIGEPQAAPSSAIVPPPLSIAVPKSAYEVFSQIFPRDVEKGHRVRYEQFTSAMTAVGFTCSKPGGGGSHYSFKSPSSWEQSIRERSVIFPRHHSGIIEAWQLREFADSLHKHFGWDKDTFEERQKS